MADNELSILIRAQNLTQEAFTKASASLGALGKDAGTASAALKRVSDAFSGSKILEEAQAATRFVSELGGAAKLTDSEQAKLNSQLTEAITKYHALGLEAPADMKALAAATAGANKSSSDILGTVGKLAGAVGIGFSVGAVVNFGKSVFDSASHVQDLSAQMGISTDAVQGFGQAAELGGSSLDTVATALTKMNEKLATGDKSTVQALNAAGLKFSDIRQMAPEEAFLAITDAIQKIPDPMDQARIAVDLFGKKGAELLPAIKDGFRETSDAAFKMSRDTIDTLDQAEKAWQRLYNRVVVVSGGLISETTHAVNSITTDWQHFFQFVENAAKFGAAQAATMAATMDRVKDVQAHADINLPSGPTKPILTKDEEDALERQAKLLADLRAELFGQDVRTAANNYVSALGSIANLSRVSAEEQAKINKVVLEAIQSYERLGKTAPAALNELYVRTVQIPEATRGITNVIKDLGYEVDTSVKRVIPTLYDLPKPIIGTSDVLAQLGIKSSLTFKDLLPAGVKTSKSSLTDLSQALTQLSQVAGGSFGEISRGLSTMVTSANTAHKAIGNVKEGVGDFKAGSTFQGILGLSSGVAGLVTSAIEAGKALFNLFDRNKGRDLVKDFAESFGGFDQLHTELLALGDAGEQLWIKLTQGVGRNNPQQAQRVIDEVNDALEEQKQKQGEVTDVTQESALATIETASQASQALDLVGEKLDTNKGQWSDWSSAVMGEIAKVASAVGAVVIPSPAPAASMPGFEGGTHGAYVDFGAGTPVVLHGRERIVTEREASASPLSVVQPIIVQVDGREIARTSARYQRSVLAPYGVR